LGTTLIKRDCWDIQNTLYIDEDIENFEDWIIEYFILCCGLINFLKRQKKIILKMVVEITVYTGMKTNCQHCCCIIGAM